MSVDKTQQSREETREELAETLEALAHKADVKGRATASAQHAWSDARARFDARTVVVVSGVGVFLVGVLLLLRRRRK